MNDYKVLHLIDHLGLGGAQRIVSKLANMDNSHYVFAMREKENLVDLNNSLYYQVQKKSKFNLKCFYKTYVYVREENVDVMHCHLLKSKLVGLFIKILMFKEVKLIFHEHGRLIEQNVLYRLFLFLSNYFVNKHIVVSKKLQDQLRQLRIPENKVNMEYNFVDLNYFNPDDSEMKTLDEINYENYNIDKINDDKHFILGFAGRIIQRKGWRTLINASKFLNDEYSIVIIGDGSESAILEEKILGSDKIYYLGQIEDIRNFFASIDCFILPSTKDACPMVLFEAQSMRVPIISSDIASVTEIIEDDYNGLLFSSDDSKQLANKIIRLRKNRDLQKTLVNNGLDFVKSKSLESYEANISSIHESLINDGME